MAFDIGQSKNKRGMFDGLYSDENIESLLRRTLKDVKDPNTAFGDDASGARLKELYASLNTKAGAKVSDEFKNVFNEAKEFPISLDKIKYSDGTDAFSGLGATTALAGNWMADHKLKTAGLAGLGIGNVAGLFDNPNIIGQLAGLGGGFAAGKQLVPKLTKKPLTGSGLALATMGGGFLGSLFDKLMAAKAKEQQFQEQYY